MSYLLRSERKQKRFLNSILNWHITLSYSSTVVYPKTIPIPAKMGKVHTRFQAKTAQKTVPFGAVHTYMAYIKSIPRAYGSKDCIIYL